MHRVTSLIAATLVAVSALAANGPPLASVWNIAATGKATSSGDLEFRITSADGSDPVDITVPVISGASQDSVARSINRSLGSQLRRDRYSVALGENGNVRVSDPHGQPNFSLELVDSNIENVRIAVQSVTPAAAPTAPMQGAPAQTPSAPVEAPPATPPAEPSPATPPSNAAPAAVPATGSPAAPPPSNSPPPTSSGAGAPASAPPPR